MPRQRVRLTLRKTVLQNEKKKPQEGVVVECPLCGHTAECYGTSAVSARRACAELAATCPLDQADEHWYQVEET